MHEFHNVISAFPGVGKTKAVESVPNLIDLDLPGIPMGEYIDKIQDHLGNASIAHGLAQCFPRWNQHMTNVMQFPDKTERIQRTLEAFNEDFKKRWQAKGDCGEFTNDIWAWEEMLTAKGWEVELYNRKIPEFSTFVDFDNGIMWNRNVKAFHAQKAMDKALAMLFAEVKGRWLLYWEEVHDEAHRHVRDGDEYKDSEDYMTVWYSMELYERQLLDGEDIPLAPVEVYTGPMISESVDPREPLEPL